MKGYSQVLAERYEPKADADFSTTASLQWMGSQIYLYRVFFGILKKAIENGLDLSTAKILEVGCGDGRWTRFIAEISKRPDLVSGTDLSRNRIEYARKFNPAIKYEVADLVTEPIQGEYDLILAWDVLMHMVSESEVRTALRQISQGLAPRGIFVFFDVWSESHFSPPADAESWGFHPDEIERLARDSGLQSFHFKKVFKVLPRLGHSEVYYRNYPEWFVRSAEKILPGKAGNFFMLFSKERETR